MNLDEYLNSGAMSVSQLRERIGAKSDAQVRQWQHAYGDRQPSPEYCVAIHEATGGAVPRWDLRPRDWWRIWPELVGTRGAPAVAGARASEIVTPTYRGPDRRKAA